ncbi:MAG TPA: hypothetical protein VN416_05605 [Desulfomonilia bacterium]|jgi:hypothetical protein|nr:hypothetical protein [Desulfomonilia bacterium]
MSPSRHPRKKDPRYLEDITYSVATQPVNLDDPFSSSLFMGRFEEGTLMEMLDKVGMIGILHKRGYRKLVVNILRQDDYTSRLYVNFDSQEKETRIIELIVREGLFRPKAVFIPSYDFSQGLSMLLVEWLALQDPRAQFRPDKPRLPGQQYPGIGGLKNMQAFLHDLCKMSGKDAIVDVPEYFHSAAIYSRLYSEIYDRMYAFFSPVDAGIMQAILRDISGTGRTLSEISFAIALNCLLDARTRTPDQWKPSEQIYPVARKLHRYVEDDQYKQIVLKTMDERSFVMDWDRYEQAKAQGLTDEI